MKVKVISVLEDNYMYLVIEERTKDAIAVDASISKKFLSVIGHCAERGRESESHPDDTPPPGSLPRQRGSCSAISRVGCVWGRRSNRWVNTQSCSQPSAKGDTLFIGGCGQFFEGTAEQMYKNLLDTLASLPPETKVFCGHEYTVRNLKFALKVEPDNEHVKEKLSWAKARDDDDIPTVPSSLEEEYLYNPFMRVREEAVQKFTGKTDPVEVTRVLRKERDEFKKPKDRLPIPALLAYQWGLLNQSSSAPK
ncbi:hydroxyacylglutathione hydrolase-like protein isoform X3 [Mixophyes fleayi]|uniref:hydroxyacylglutathione hydrolase-like protein isoform X3 n=1 Tax=Mixophyes fleayi TaxID=3061075 RepID=UPI003F4DFA58